MVMRSESRCARCGNTTFTAVVTVNDEPLCDSGDEWKLYLDISCASCSALLAKVQETRDGVTSLEWESLDAGPDRRQSHDRSSDQETPTVLWRPRR